MPSVASLARIFREAGVARLEPKKKPRSAWRRFVYPAPNACWQLDATEYVLTGGRRCVIFQLIDDHSRYAVASHVAWGETAQAAIAVFDKAVAAHGVPQRLLSDNGTRAQPVAARAPGPVRRPRDGALGVEPITGKPYKPTTQGKNERFHQTLFRYLDKQPLAEQPGRAAGPGRRVRPHLQHRAPPPRTARPRHAHRRRGRPPRRPRLLAPPAGSFSRPRPTASRPAPSRRQTCPTTPKSRNVTTAGTFSAGQGPLQGRRTHAPSSRSWSSADGDKITVADLHGEILIEHTRPGPGVTYVGNRRPRGPHPRPQEASPMS